MDHTGYISSLSTRYASKEMQYLFSEEYRARNFRKLWLLLAKCEKELGLNITDEQIAELEAHLDDIDFEVIKEREKLVKHDVMAQIYAYGLKCPKAKGIIHLGATSCYVDDNADIIAIKEASNIILKKMAQVLANLKDFALKYKSTPCLAYTHLQPAQLTTMGKRATLWMYELVLDIKNLEYQLKELKPLGCKGTTGTQASFLDLFQGDVDKVLKLDQMIAEGLGFKEAVAVSGQTYTRKIDTYILSVLGNIAASAYKFASDLRILQSFDEMEEPFEKKQVGSSAMPYKRNPMRAERMCGLARYVMSNVTNGYFTSATQGFERTLDDSSNRRLVISESFLAIDAILNVYINITDGLVVNKKVIESRVEAHLPFIATENIMMEAVKKGGDRQALHEILRVYSQKAADDVKLGKKNHLLLDIANDPRFNLTLDELQKALKPSNFIGIADRQTSLFIKKEINPLLKRYHQSKISAVLDV